MTRPAEVGGRDVTDAEAEHSANPPEGFVEIEGLGKAYANGVHALTDVNLSVARGEFLTILGPSGSGKTTLLMAIGGFEQPTSGEIRLNGRSLADVPPQKRNFGIVFQSYALFPHMSVLQNIEYPLRARRVPQSRRRDLVDSVLKLVDLEGMSGRKPSQLSGGQQQRVALARALVYEPDLLLLDEPLGALDRSLRDRMQVELRQLNRRLGITFVSVTHDQEEALTMSDRIVVMNSGRIEQIGSPHGVHARPASEFVARFLGRANLFDAVVRSVKPDHAVVDVTGVARSIEIPRGDQPIQAGDAVFVMVRPDKMRLASSADPPKETSERELLVDVSIVEEIFLGNNWRYALTSSAGSVECDSASRVAWDRDTALSVSWSPASSWLVPRKSVQHNREE